MKRKICVPEVPASQMVLTIITDEQGGRGIIRDGRIRADMAHIVVGNGAVTAQDDF